MIMRRFHVVLLLSIALCLPSVAGAQKRPKDPILQGYLEEQFTALNKKLDELSAKVADLNAEMAKLKQQQTDTLGELRNAQTVARNTDSSLTSFRLSSQQDVITLKTDVAKILQDVTALMEGAKKAEAAAAPEAQKIEGYITDPPAAGKDTCTISKGSAAGVKVGMRFTVFKANDPNSQVGLLEITEVLDANNSHAKILHSKPGIKLEFSDIVRVE
jgi:outer membrane murein-binding lipoprotein Lpp